MSKELSSNVEYINKLVLAGVIQSISSLGDEYKVTENYRILTYWDGLCEVNKIVVYFSDDKISVMINDLDYDCEVIEVEQSDLQIFQLNNVTENFYKSIE